jgi:hypothetical protein
MTMNTFGIYGNLKLGHIDAHGGGGCEGVPQNRQKTSKKTWTQKCNKTQEQDPPYFFTTPCTPTKEFENDIAMDLASFMILLLKFKGKQIFAFH